MKSARTSCDQPITKIASGRSARTASIVSGALTSSVSTTGAPTSSKEHWPERLGSIGPGRVTTPTISAPDSRAASRQPRPIVSKLTQTARTGADSTEAAAQPLVTTAVKAENVAQGQRQARCRSRSSPAGWAAVSADRVGAAIESEARRIERETACSALAHRMATSAWRRIYFALGVPTTALAAVAGASALAHYRIAAAVFALGAAVASALMTGTNPAGQVAEHRKAGSRYRAVENRARVLWQVTCADETDSESLRQELDELIEEWSKTSEGSPPLFESLHRRARRRAEEGR